MKYRLAIFDFDGTLADSFPFFLGVFNQLAQRHGFKQIDLEQTAALRGYDARQMMQHVGLPSWKLPFVARNFIALMRERVSAIKPFEGVNDMLAHLTRADIAVAVVSSNSYDNVCAVLGPENTRMVGHFECGMSIFGKSARIAQALTRAAASSHEAIYIGDQITDLEASRQAGVAFGAVAWGYGTIESLRKHSPEEEFACVADIKRLAD